MCDKKKKNKKKKKTKKLSQFLKSHISGTREAISLKFGMWSAEGGGNVHSKNRLVSSRKHRATEVRKLRFLSSCQYTHGCYAPASWAARHTTVCLDTCTGSCIIGLHLHPSSGLLAAGIIFIILAPSSGLPAAGIIFHSA